MKIYNEALTIQSQKPREIFDITTRVKAAMEKSGFRDGIILVSTLHSNSAVIVNDGESDFIEDLDKWLGDIAPIRDNYKHQAQGDSTATTHLLSLLLHHQAIVSFSDGRLDLGPWQLVQFVELDGLRPKRIVMKVMGE